MRKLAFLVASIYACFSSLIHGANSHVSPFVLSRDYVHLGHGSHMSHASHYSAASYNHRIVKDSSSTKSISNSQKVKIKEIIEKEEYRRAGYVEFSKCGCFDLKVEKCKLVKIDGLSVNKWCYRLYYMVSYVDSQQRHSHQYYDYYITTDRKIFFSYRTESPNPAKPIKVDGASWIKKIADILK